MRIRTRATALVATVALIGSTASGTAGAQEADELYAAADAVTATVSVLGTTLGSFAGTEAVATSLPKVEVAGFGFQGPEGTPGVGVTKAVADAVAAAVRDPQDGTNCGVPELAALPVADVLRALEVCSASEAAVPSAMTPQAAGAAQAGALTLNGQALADVIFDLLLEPIMAQLDGVVGEVQASLAPLEDGLAAICDELPDDLSATGLAEQANDAGLPVTDVIRALPEGEQILESLESDCLLSLDALVDVVAAVPAIAEDLVRDTLLGALDSDLLSISLGTSSSSITGTDDALKAVSNLQAFELTTASLQSLVDAVEQLVADQVQGVLDDVVAALPAELGAITSQVPAVGDVVGPILAQLDGLVDDAPLLQVSVADSVATAASTPGSSDVDTTGSSAGGVVVRISPAIADLLGIPAEVSAAPGQRLAIAEGTPLESVLQVGAVEGVTETVDGIEVAGARVTATEARLLTGLNGGIVVGTGVTEAVVGGSLAAAPAQPTLPRTGSSDTATLLAGMGLLALLGATLHLRRRLS
ncbi:MAG: LPXTG cell wall anchor domain-containing protein [Acidimicrobiia bacterium]